MIFNVNCSMFIILIKVSRSYYLNVHNYNLNATLCSPKYFIIKIESLYILYCLFHSIIPTPYSLSPTTAWISDACVKYIHCSSQWRAMNAGDKSIKFYVAKICLREEAFTSNICGRSQLCCLYKLLTWIYYTGDLFILQLIR